MENEKRTSRQRKEDAVLNRVLIWFGAAVAVEFLMLMIDRYFIRITTSSESIMLAYHLSRIIFVAIWVGLAGAVACGIWLFRAKNKGKKATLPTVLTLAFLALFICMAVSYYGNAAGVQFLCMAVPAVAVLALIYYLYQKEFFFVTLLCAAGIAGLWLFRRANGGHQALIYGLFAAAGVLTILVAVLCRMLQKNNGALVRGEKRLHILPKNANYGLLYLTCGVVAAVLIAACALGTTVAYYLLFALVAWVFVMAIYYTVKLM